MLTIIIPARNEQFLQKTVDEVLGKAEGQVECIAVLDGYWPDPALRDDPRLKIIHRGEARGMRAGINAGVAAASGDVIMKLDGHCMLEQGYDLKVRRECVGQTVVVPRRKRLDAEAWVVKDVGKPDVDYEYITNPAGGDDMSGAIWTSRALARAGVEVDDTPTFQGSCWAMTVEYFHFLELMDEETYGTFYNEAQEICLKAWLSGGRVVVDKRVWYAHLHKGKQYGRGYALGSNQRPIALAGVKKWTEQERAWHKQTLPFSALLERFPDMPTWTSRS